MTVDVSNLLTLTGTVELRAPGGTEDEFGDAVDETSSASFACWLHQGSGGAAAGREENTVGGDVQSETWTVYLEPSAAGVVDGSAAITVNGTTFEFDGPPHPWTDPLTGEIAYVEATVRKVT